MAKDAVLVFGANGAIGLDLCQKLCAAGREVIGTIRSEKGRDALENAGVEVHTLDVMDASAIEALIADVADRVSIVLSVFGGGLFKDPSELPDGIGNIAITDAMKAHGLTRFLLMTSIGCGATREHQTEMMIKVLGTNLLEKDKAEEHLMQSGLEWIILRPGGLGKPDNPMQPLEPSGNAIYLEGEKLRGFVARGDVADMLVDLAGPKGDNALSKILHAVDKDMYEEEGGIAQFELG